jgi:flagellar hook-basal body complex protein FliE
MNVMPIDAVSIGQINMSEISANETVSGGPPFMQAVGSAVNEINSSLIDADTSARALAAGENIPVQDVMMAMEHAHLKLQFAVEVRNRVVDAYQNLTNMQM